MQAVYTMITGFQGNILPLYSLPDALDSVGTDLAGEGKKKD